jgi:hypothetical protein
MPNGIADGLAQGGLDVLGNLGLTVSSGPDIRTVLLIGESAVRSVMI